ncbi:MAG: phenylalanine--tRNA ligase subunit alpha [Chitinivibrionales bacterium]|nr:phenylalanine--tRNA ligase subunit alpha [Chitinivibrionales bacterium]
MNDTNATPSYTTLADLEKLRTEACSELAAITTDEAAQLFKNKYLGKKGILRLLSKGLRELPLEERKSFGSRVNEISNQIETQFESEPWKQGSSQAVSAAFDPTLPGWPVRVGTIHPLTKVRDEICSIFFSMGFDIAYGPEVETDYYNFEALNFPAHHPARDMQDTFFIEEKLLLRTHTSPVQIRVMEKTKPPIRSIMPGMVYRNEEISSRSYCQFGQIEGLYVDTAVSLSDLKGTLLAFARQFFDENTKIKIRPSFFPFTEPSIEIDVQCFLCKGNGCSVCKQSGYLEILGAGMVHPNVLANCGIDSDAYSGFAFGMGIERIALLKYRINDIRLFYENDVRFLQQF